MKKKDSQKKFDGIIFDIDNVLIDTRYSYLDAIRWTVEIYLTEGKVPLFQPAPKNLRPYLLSRKDIHQFKLLGGFNDDWDCCYGLLIYLLNLPFKTRTLEHLKTCINLKEFARHVEKKSSRPDRPLRVDGLVKMFGRPTYLKIEKVSRIFQEVYLGKNLFRKIERREAYYWKKKGLIAKEKPVFKLSLLKKLKKTGLKLGITTGRNRFEAVYTLQKFRLLDFFDAMTTMGEVKRAEEEQRKSLRKPHPFSLVQTAKRLGTGLKLLYVGDLPDDIITAKRAKSSIDVAAAGFVGLSENPQLSLSEMKRHHADYLFGEPAHLLKIVS